MPLDDTKLDVLAGHYSETSELIQATLKKRDRLFAGLLLILFVMLFQLYAPSESTALFSELMAEKMGASEGINFIYVQSAIWFVLLAVTIKYLQNVVFGERQYDYIHSLEAIISAEYTGQAFTREGTSYLEDYPTFSKWTSFLYTILFPAILIFISTAKIVNEFRVFGRSEFLVWFNALMFVFLLISVGLYLQLLHFSKKADQ